MLSFVPFTSDDQVAAIGAGLLARTLPKTQWSHAAHFAAALWLLRCRPDINASDSLPGFIRAYNEATGVANTDHGGYHETITQASLRATQRFLADRPHSALFVICNELMASPFGNTGWLLAYWSRGRLFSVEARRRWLEPDLQPLPF